MNKASVFAGMILALPLYLLITHGLDPFVLLYLAYLLVCPTILYEVFALEEGRVNNRFRLAYRIPWGQVVLHRLLVLPVVGDGPTSDSEKTLLPLLLCPLLLCDSHPVRSSDHRQRGKVEGKEDRGKRCTVFWNMRCLR